MKRLYEYILEYLVLEADDAASDNDKDLPGNFGDTEDSDDSYDSDDSKDSKDSKDSDESEEHEESKDQDSKEEKKNVLDKKDIIFDIWETTDKKVTHLKNNTNYLKIEYKYKDNKYKVYIDFLLGYDKNDKTWKLWVGKIGGLSYDEKPLCSLNTTIFNEAIIISLDKIVKYVQQVYDDKENWVQYWLNL